MTAVPSPFGSSAGKYNFLGTAKLTNCFAEIRDDHGKARFVIVPSDGTTLFSSVTDTPCRGTLFRGDQNLAYTVHSGRAYSVISTGVASSVGVIPGQDRVRLAGNQKTTPQIAVRCNAGVYCIENGAATKITDPDLPTVEDICEIDGYVIYILSDGRWFWSGLNEITTIDPLDFASAESASDKLVAGWSWAGYLLLVGQTTIEPWKLTGVNVDEPFEPMPTVIPRGCIGKWTIANCDNAVMFVGDDGIVYRLNGFQPSRISNHEVERLIQTETDPATITAQSWSRGGHAFYELKGTNWSKVYDANTKQWHDRASFQQTTWRMDHAFAGWNKTICGDKLSGMLYFHDNVNTEADGIQIATIRFPTLNTFPMGGILDALHLDYVTGQGLTSTTAQGYDPLLMLRLSKDGSNSFPYERQLKTGRRGAYGRVTTRRLGSFGPQGVVMELAMSDPVGRALANTDVAVRPLRK